MCVLPRLQGALNPNAETSPARTGVADIHLPADFTTLHVVCEHIFHPFLFAKNARLLNLSFVVKEYAIIVPFLSLARMCSTFCP